MKNQTAFTLVELLIVLAIVSIVLAFGVPSYQTFVQNNRIASSTNLLKSQLQLARTEAISRNEAVSMERTGATAQEWSDGWRMYTTDTGNTSYDSSSDELIRVTEALSEGLNIRVSSTGNRYVSYAQDGRLDETGPIIFAICDARGEDSGAQITISMTGRVSLDDTVADCNP